MLELLAALLVFSAVVAGIFAFSRATSVGSRQSVRHRLGMQEQARGMRKIGGGELRPDSIASRVVEWQTEKIRGAATAPRKRSQNMLVQAGWSGFEPLAVFRIAQFIGTATGALAGILIASLWRGNAVLMGSAGAALGYIAPQIIVSRIASRRREQIYRELPSVLDLLVVTLEAGVGLAEAIRMVGHESERHGSVLGYELSISAGEMETGVSISDSLRSLGERTGVDDVRSLSALLIQSGKMGGRLAPALRAASELLDSRRRLRAEEQAHRAAVKMLIPLVALMLPAMVIVIVGPAGIQLFRAFRMAH